MSALGHTMASMPTSAGGKPGPSGGGTQGNPRKGQGKGGQKDGGAHDANGAKGGEKDGQHAQRRGGRGDGTPKGGSGHGQSLNHLLSFTLPPRVAPPSSHLPARRQRRTGASYVPFNKERYVNAQYRFLVKPTGDYTAYFADSDIYLNWSDILTVLIPTSSALTTAHGSTSAALAAASQPHLEAREDAACPICLSPPTAPRMTKCGHVFCYPCILHYLTVHDAPAASGSSTPTPGYYLVPGAARPAATSATATGDAHGSAAAPKWKRCPVCWDAVYARDLKAVQWWDPKARAQEFEQEDVDKNLAVSPLPKDVLCMRLIERPHLTTLALPKSSTWPVASSSTSEQPLIAQHSAPWHFQPDVMTFCKFMLATPDQLLENLDSNLRELKEERSLLTSFVTKDEIGVLFVDMAERKVHEQMEKVANELDTQAVRSRMNYARKELVEHEEIERGNMARHAEARSRRQRRREESKLAQKTGNDDEEDQETAPSAETEHMEGMKTGDDRDRDLNGTQEFLAVQSQRQGAYHSETPPSAAAAAADEPSSAVRSGRNSSTRTRRNLNPPAPSSSSFFFYQASSGQNIFLHPLDIKIMLSAFGAYSAFPTTLLASVQGADEGSMNEDMRKRCKYLAHLTHGADIVFIEVNWEKMAREAEARHEEPLIAKSVLRMYDQALSQRRNRRRDKEKKEDRAKTRFEEAERAKRPPMTTSVGAGRGAFAGASRSPNLGPVDSVVGSLSSQTSLSPGMREALLLSAEESGLDQDFPAAGAHRQEASHELHVGSPGAESTGSVASSGAGHAAPYLNGTAPLSVSRTVWGTRAARSSAFADALHSSSRTRPNHEEHDAAADFDAWFELEEDFILGARNDRTVSQGRGLNRQIKGGQSNGRLPAAQRPSQTDAQQSPPKTDVQQQPYEPLWRPSRSPDKPDNAANLEPATATSTTQPSAKPNGGKQQRKKKFVLTSGGRGTA